MLRPFLAAAALVTAGAAPVRAQTPPAETVEYYALDAIGSVRVVFDPAGTILGRSDYTPFGGELSSGAGLPSQRFAGLFRDGEAGLDYAQARSYQVRTGRFNAPDPVYAGMFKPQTWNRYAYAYSNPISLSDPSGLCVLGDCDWREWSVNMNFAIMSMPPIYGQDPPERQRGPQGTRAHKPEDPKPPTEEPKEENKPGKNDCEAFAGQLTAWAKQASGGVVRRWATGVKMMNQALRDPWAGITDPRGFRPELTYDQGADVHRHVTMLSGARLAGPLGYAPELIMDGLDMRDRLLDHIGADAALLDNLAGMKIGDILVKAASDGVFDSVHGQIKAILCDKK